MKTKNIKFLQRCCGLLSVFCVRGAAWSQSPLPTPSPATSGVRQKLRAAILKIAASSDPQISNVRPDLALPMAQLGDWDAALRLLKDDMNAPRARNELWHWRAYQLAHAAQWREVMPVAAHIGPLEMRADALLFAARTAIERGVLLHQTTADSQTLETLLLKSAPLLAKKGSIEQKSYRAYLWARGGDLATAQRIFARVFTAAERADAHEIEVRQKQETAKTPQYSLRASFLSRHARNVLSMQAHAGLLLPALQHADQADDFLLGWWIAGARTHNELEALSRVVEKLPASRSIEHWFALSLKSSARGDTAQGRVWFERGQSLLAEIPLSDHKKQQNALMAFYAAQFLPDVALQKQVVENFRTAVEQAPAAAKFMTVAEISALPALLELRDPQMIGEVRPLSLAQLDALAEQLRIAPPSKIQFDALETLAMHYFLQKQPEKLLPVARNLLTTAQFLAAQEAQKPAKKPTMFNPYWPVAPRVLTAIFWLQRAGDAPTAATFARQFAAHAPENERPYAAMILFQLGYFALADQTFDPAREIPRLMARQRADWKQKKAMDWSLFVSWNEFAAAEARFRAPEAPFRWLGQIENVEERGQVLRSWIGALFPEPLQEAPFVMVSPTGSSMSA